MPRKMSSTVNDPEMSINDRQIHAFGFTVFSPPGSGRCFPLMHQLEVGFDFSVAEHFSDNNDDGREMNRFDTIEQAYEALSSNTQMNFALSFDHKESRVEKQIHCYLSGINETLDGVVISGKSPTGTTVGSGSIFRCVE